MSLRATISRGPCAECKEEIAVGDLFEVLPGSGDFAHSECVDMPVLRAKRQAEIDEREFAETATPAEKAVAGLPGAHPL